MCSPCLIRLLWRLANLRKWFSTCHCLFQWYFWLLPHHSNCNQFSDDKGMTKPTKQNNSMAKIKFKEFKVYILLKHIQMNLSIGLEQSNQIKMSVWRFVFFQLKLMGDCQTGVSWAASGEFAHPGRCCELALASDQRERQSSDSWQFCFRRKKERTNKLLFCKLKSSVLKVFFFFNHCHIHQFCFAFPFCSTQLADADNQLFFSFLQAERFFPFLFYF